MNNNIGIVFSGGCFSGKTTSINKFKEFFGEENCIVLNEVIRDILTVPIDELRSDYSEYLRFQEKVINMKIDQEDKAFESNHNKIILIDRSLADSLFYLTFYLDKSNLQESEIEMLASLYQFVKVSARIAYFSYYDVILNFSPLTHSINAQTENIFRSSNVDTLKSIECDMIKNISKSFIVHNEEIDIDLNKKDCIETFLNADISENKRKEINDHPAMSGKIMLV